MNKVMSKHKHAKITNQSTKNKMNITNNNKNRGFNYFDHPLYVAFQIIYFFQAQHFIVTLFSIFPLIMIKYFMKYNEVQDAGFLTIGHERTEFEAYYQSFELYFSIRSGHIKFFCFIFVVSSMNNIFALNTKILLVW